MSGSIFDNFGDVGTNPGLMSLLGLAGGFGQAAMPQPYKGGVPFGAALGMAAQGLGQGARQAYQAQQEQQQALAGRLANTAAASALPLTVAKNQMLAKMWSNPDAIMQMLNGGAPQPQINAPAATDASAGSAGAPTPPPELAPFIQQSAAKYGIPTPILTAVLQQESSMGKTSPNLGQILPSTAAAPGYGVKPMLPGELKNPANNIDFTANYLAARGKAAGVTDWNDPRQAAKGLAAYNGGGDPQYVQHVMRYVPAASGGAAASAAPATPGTSDALATYQNYEDRARRAQIAQFFGLPTAEDPAVLHATAQQYLKLALAGPEQRAKSDNEITMDRYGNRYQGTRFLGRGSEVKEAWDPVSQTYVNQDVGALGPDYRPIAGSPTPLPAAPGPQEKARLELGPAVQKQQIENDGHIVNDTLEHVIDNVAPAKQQLFQLRELAQNPETATGAAGQARSQFKNWVQTFAPDYVSALTGDASPSQEFNKIALMGAGKQERGDLGARGGFRAMELYLNANPNLDMQPTANKDMANALLVSHQYHADYAQGATNFYNQSADRAIDPKNPAPYQRLAKYDQTFSAKMKPELYATAISAINGKPSDQWARGLDADQVKIVAGILQRTDPSAVHDLHGQPVPVSKFTSVIGPTDIAP
jgi:hypothetical protein